MIVKEGTLYIFLESQSSKQKGKIIAYKSNDLIKYEELGVILEKNFHLSYPFVFEANESQYLLPESELAGEVALYKFEDFPFNPTKIKLLLKGDYFDSSLFFYNKLWYLFTTSSRGLEIFWSEDLINTEFQPHKKNPITNNPQHCRSAGAVFTINNKFFRPCQDCSNTYGENINIMEIIELSSSKYHEKEVQNHFFKTTTSRWNGGSGHHLSIVNFLDKHIIATDKKHDDMLINKYLSLFRMLQK